MIDLDLLESAVKKVWYTRTEDEDAVHSHVISELGILDIITSLRQAEKDAARYRWLKGQGRHDYDVDDFFDGSCDRIDAKIDEAMQCSK